MMPASASNSRYSIWKRLSLAMACILTLSTVSTFAIASGGGESAEGGEGGSQKKSVFDNGPLTIQLPPMWIPTTNKHKKGTAPQYTPVTISITSYGNTAAAMCYKLPYLTQTFLFALNTVDLKLNRERQVDVSGLNSMLLNEAIKATGKHMVKAVDIVSATPRPTPANQDLLKLCQ